MSIVNIFTKQAPNLSGYEFDAVLEDTFEASVELTTYPIESGVRVSDHRILQPLRWSMVGAVSNNPLKVQVTDFLAGGLSNLANENPWVAGVAGLSAGWLAGDNSTRSRAVLDLLRELMSAGEPFTVNAGDVTLKNMVITRLSRTKDATNENGLIFVADLQELITLDRISAIETRASSTPPPVSKLRDGDPAQSACARAVKKGQQMTREAGKAVSDSVNSVLDGIF